ncbi:site-2 protease family protein [Streptomyces sp. NPDC015242]|uniref:site-2 protease family protein n=1 Tax=Streptomyces sp. NPDC015242 TaxID=3364951 RepID=UPI0036FF0417
MEESGGRGQPRSGNDESAEHHAGPPARPTGPASADERPTDERATDERPTGERRLPSGPRTSAPATAPAPGPAEPATSPEPGPAAADAPQAPSAPGPAAADAPRAGAPSPTGAAAGGSSSAAADRSPADGVSGAERDGSRAPGGSRTSDGGTKPDGDAHPDRAHAGDRGTGSATTVPEADPRQADPAASGPQPERRDAAPATARPGPDPRHQAPEPTPASHRPEAPASAPGTPDRAPETPAAPRTAPAHGPRHLAHSADRKGPAPQRPEPRGGLLMGRPFGVPVYVAPSWFLVAALITWVFGGQLERVLPDLGAARYLVSLFFAVAFYASVLVHELAHTVAALRFKLPVRRIQLQFFGGVSEIEKEAETPGREFVLAFVGPLLSLVLAGVFYAGLQAVEPGTVPGVLLAGLMISNLIVAAFNLLPGLPLDGGRMLRAIVWKLTGKPMSGTIAAAWVGRALAVSVLVGLPLLTQSGALGSDAVDNVGMDTVLDALLAAILAAIIWTGAGNSLRMARLREHLPELRARTLTRRAVPVETDTPLSEALRRANAAGARALVVVDADGRPLSLVREAAIVGVPEHRRPWVAVGGLAQELTDGMRVSAELAGEELLDALRATPATEYLVVEETGEIYGVLSAADVERAFVKAMARPS